MENQHRKITGYRDLTADEIALINEGKALAAQVGDFIAKVRATPVAPHPPQDGITSHDPRWVAVAQTQLQQGFMALIRGIAKPSTF